MPVDQAQLSAFKGGVESFRTNKRVGLEGVELKENPLDFTHIAEADKNGDYDDEFKNTESDDEYSPNWWKSRPDMSRIASENDENDPEYIKLKNIAEIIAADITNKSCAKWAENPSNWHQAAVHFCLCHSFPNFFSSSKGVVRGTFLLLSFLIVMAQIVTASTVLFGIKNRSCGSNNDCEFGTWCKFSTFQRGQLSPFSGTYDVRICDGCHNEDLEYFCSRLVNKNPYDDDYKVNATDNERYECEGCYRTSTQDYITWDYVLANNIESMNMGDMMTLLLASMVISLAVSCEIRDIKLAEISQRSRHGKTVWHVLLIMLHSLRQYAFLPMLVATIPTLAAYMGSNSIKTCMNTVSMLFMVELDNSAFQYGLREDIRSYVEETGRATVKKEQLLVLNYLKLIYVVCLPLFIFMSMRRIAESREHTTSALGQMMLTFYLAGMMEIAISHVLKGDPPLEIDIWYPGRFSRRKETMIGFFFVTMKSLICFGIILFTSPSWTNHYLCVNLGSSFVQFDSQHNFYWQNYCSEPY